jgi:hypothetical protein
MKTNWWLKRNVLEYSVFPQLPSFCGVAACCGAIGSIIGRQFTEQMLHANYQVGRYTKLRAPAGCSTEDFATLPRGGPGFSNWDVIRLCNSVLLDEGKTPAAAVLCGKDFVRETAAGDRVDRILNWLRDDSCHAIVHTIDHYTLAAGAYQSPTAEGTYLLLADSAKLTGPVRSLALSKLRKLAEQDERYGFVLVSDKAIPTSLFQIWTSSMLPPEVTEQQRFARINKS